MNINQVLFEGLNASSLSVLTGQFISLETARELLFQSLEKYYLLLKKGERTELKRLYTARMLALNETVSFLYKETTQQFTVKGISETGLLQVQKEQQVFELDLGEIKWLL